MKVQDIRLKAREMGIKPLRMKKTGLIRAIQKAESNIVCYGTERVDNCGEYNCLWRSDCAHKNDKG
jgi:hypothetical protein